MNAHARHSGLRPKRCLPAELHSISPTTRLHPKTATVRFRADSASGIPKSRQTIVTAPKGANSRFFTDCYPISAAFTPRVNQILARLDANSAAISDHEIHN